MLGQTLDKITLIDSISKNDEIYQVLKRAQNSRNFIAHEGGAVGDLYGVNAAGFRASINLLQEHVENVALDDNIVSRWAYEISEREPAPRSMVEGYSSLVMKWVFGNSVA